jgi:hypothetical protein
VLSFAVIQLKAVGDVLQVAVIQLKAVCDVLWFAVIQLFILMAIQRDGFQCKSI